MTQRCGNEPEGDSVKGNALGDGYKGALPHSLLRASKMSGDAFVSEGGHPSKWESSMSNFLQGI